MGDGTRIVKLSDGSSIEVPTGWPFRPDEKGYTGVTQSALFVLNDEEFEPMAMCEVHFKSLGKDYDDICDDGQLGLDEFVATNLDGVDVARNSPSLLVSRDLSQRVRSADDLERHLGACEFWGYWLFVNRFEDGEKVDSQMTLGTDALTNLIKSDGFTRLVLGDRADDRLAV